MKKLTLIILLAMIVIMGVGPPVFAEDEKDKPTITYQTLSKDGEVSELEQVKVNQIVISTKKQWYTLAEIDFYIEQTEIQLKTIKEQLEKLKEVRDNIEFKAKKVRLKVEGESGS